MTNMSPTAINILTAKLYDNDSDIRYMSLNDMITQFVGNSGSTVSSDFMQSAKIADGLLHTLNDSNGEVQNLTLKALGPFSQKAHWELLPSFVLRVTELPTDSELDNSLSAMATRAIVTSLPRPSALSSSAPRANGVDSAYNAISQVVIPRLIGYYPTGTKANKSAQINSRDKGLLVKDLETGHDSGYIEILTQVARCYGPMLTVEETDALQAIVLKLLESSKTSAVMKKKVTAALSTLSAYFNDALLSTVVSHIVEAFRNPHLMPSNRRLYISALGAMAQAIPTKFGPHLKTLTPFVLSPISQQELDEQMDSIEDDEDRDPAIDEVREAALQTLEAFLLSCSEHMHAYNADILASILRFVKYDPDWASLDDDDDDELKDASDDEFEIEEDFEEEGNGDNDDDVSWKVRRGAAKALHAMIAVRGNELLEDSDTYDRIARTLVDRFKEREEGVRLEFISTLAFLIRKTAAFENHSGQSTTTSATGAADKHKRKRTRRTSDISMIDSVKCQRLTGSMSPDIHMSASSGPPGSLAAVGPNIVSGSLKLLQSGQLRTKQAILVVLQDYVIAREGSITDVLDQLLPMLADILKSSNKDSHASISVGHGANSASSATIQIEAFKLISEICKSHSSTEISPRLAILVPEVSVAVRHKTPKTGVEALKLMEQLVKTVTPPRTAAGEPASAKQVEKILEVATEAISARSTDSLVRNDATHVVAVILGRTTTAQGGILISDAARRNAFNLLLESSRNEISRYSTIKAIDVLGGLLPPKAALDHDWIAQITVELAHQLRKANRSLRSVSLQALRTLLADKQCYHDLPLDAAKEVSGMLVPLLSALDLHLIGPSIMVLAALITNFKSGIVSEELVQAIGTVAASPLAASVLDQLADLVEVMGAGGVGKDLMSLLLSDVSVRGSPAIVGKLIGNLLVAGGSTVGVTVDAFHAELSGQKETRPKCLALSVLGEYGLRSGAASASSLPPSLFIDYFSSPSHEVALAAAVSLGRVAAGEGNAKIYVPAILSLADQKKESRKLVLYAIRETLMQIRHADELDSFLGGLWNASIATSSTDYSRSIGAECLASLVAIQSRPYLLQLHALLSDEKKSARGTAISAFRDVFATADASLDQELRPIMIEVLTAMMRDSDLDNRRAALNAFNSAAKNRPDLVLPYLTQLLPLVIDQTLVDQGLIREVTMGPFKHKVDDGLECRKGAYETLYSLSEAAPGRIDIPKVYDRVVAGLDDDTGIRSLCSLMTTKLMITAPEETLLRLDAIATKLKTTLNKTLKETAVRHEHERLDEAKRGCLRLALQLQHTFPTAGATHTEWQALFTEIKATPALKKIHDEIERGLKDRS